MYIDLTALHPYIVAFLPILAGFIAGLLRQDKFPNWLNELLTYLVILAIALFQAFTDGKLGGSPLAAFGLVAAYITALLHTSYGLQFQQIIQGSVLSIGKPGPAPASPADVPALVAAEVRKYYTARQDTALTPAVYVNTPPAMAQQSPQVTQQP